jgi:hypothetical protein
MEVHMVRRTDRPLQQSARIIRGNKVRRPAPDRGLRSAGADGTTDKPADPAQ